MHRTLTPGEPKMFEYEIHQNRHAALVEEANQARLARQAHLAARAAARAARAAGTARKDKGTSGPVSSLRSHFTRAA